jgi:iron complex outermembrane receptor protein
VIGARWRATPTMLWRASVGTGFRSPTLNQLRSPAQSYGSTATEFACNAGLQAVATELGATPCNADAAYPQVFSGNSALKPERSLQGNLGLRIEPLPGHSIGVDLWALRLQDRIGSADQSLVFANPQAYPGLWTTVPGSSGTQLAYAAYPMNLGTGMSSGVDVDASVRRGSALGLFDSQLRVSAILRSVGKPYPGADWASSLGDGYYGSPTLKWRANWRTSFTRLGWTHTLTGRYQSGYTEAPVDVYVLDANGQLTGDTAKIRLKMPGQLLWDWQSTWQVNGTLQLTAGIVNVFNTKPPLSLYESDTTGKAQILGYDERYYDARGRMLTLEARLSF